MQPKITKECENKTEATENYNDIYCERDYKSDSEAEEQTDIIHKVIMHKTGQERDKPKITRQKKKSLQVQKNKIKKEPNLKK